VFETNKSLVESRPIGSLNRQVDAVLAGPTTEYSYAGDVADFVLAAGDYLVGLAQVAAGTVWWAWGTTIRGQIYGEFSYKSGAGGAFSAGWSSLETSSTPAFRFTAVPEIDRAGMGSVLAVVAGALSLLERRRLQSA